MGHIKFVIIVSKLTCSSMEAFAQRIPPKNESEWAGLLALIKFLVVLTAIITSSAPSEFISDQPSSLNPLIASLKPLREVDTEQKYTIKSYTHTSNA